MTPPDSSTSAPPPADTRESTADHTASNIASGWSGVRSAVHNAKIKLNAALEWLDDALAVLALLEKSAKSTTCAPAQRIDNPQSPCNQHSAPHAQPDSVLPPRRPDYSVCSGPGSCEEADNASRCKCGQNPLSHFERSQPAPENTWELRGFRDAPDKTPNPEDEPC